MTDDEKIASILSDIKDYIGSYYTEMIVESCYKEAVAFINKSKRRQ